MSKRKADKGDNNQIISLQAEKANGHNFLTIETFSTRGIPIPPRSKK